MHFFHDYSVLLQAIIPNCYRENIKCPQIIMITCSICRFVPFQSISERIYVPTDDTVLMRLSFIMARQKIIYNRHFVHCHIQMLPIFIIKHFRTHFLMSALLAIFFCHCHTYIIHSYVLIGKSIFFSSHICNNFFVYLFLE